MIMCVINGVLIVVIYIERVLEEIGKKKKDDINKVFILLIIIVQDDLDIE